MLERDLTCHIELKAVPGRQNRPGVASPRGFALMYKINQLQSFLVVIPVKLPVCDLSHSTAGSDRAGALFKIARYADT
jgi:hypothetical protein